MGTDTPTRAPDGDLMSKWRRRRRRVNFGQWQVERERCRIESPRPQAGFREAAAIANVVSEVVKGLALPQTDWLAQLRIEWAKLVDPDMARHTRPGRLNGTTLVAFVDNSVWIQELRGRRTERALQAIRGRFGAGKISALQLRLDPDGQF